MVSVASGGTADRIAARILFKVLRAGSGTPARYSSMFFGAPLPFAAELRLPDFTFFMRAMLQGLSFQVHAPDHRSLISPTVLLLRYFPRPPSGMLDDLPVAFPKEVCHLSCWKPTRRCYETKNGRPAGHVGADGPQDSRCLGTFARLWNRAAHRADQRRPVGRESRDSVSRAVEAGARRRDRIRVGRLRE